MCRKQINKLAKKTVIAGGSATGSGINFQAAVTSIVEAHIAVGAKLDWLIGIAHDVPVSVSAETGGPGDDIGILFEDSTRAEVQVKRGLTVGVKMWEAVIKLAKAVNNDTVDYGILIVSPDSSGTIKSELARDLERLAGGRSDGLKCITNTFIKKLENESLTVEKIVKRLRIVTLNCLTSDGDSIRAAKAWLGHICSRGDVDHAWNALYIDGTKLIEFRGARAVDSVAQVLRSEGIDLKAEYYIPSHLLNSLCQWTVRSTNSFSIPGIPHPLLIDDAWLELDVQVVSEGKGVQAGLAEALEQYHSWSQGERRHDDGIIVKGQTIGRFERHCVLVGGPGMGKSTLLKKLGRIYASEGFPVIHFSAKTLMQRIRATGCNFEEGIVALGTDSSNLALTARSLSLASHWVVLCDALDEAGNEQESVCEGLLKFSAGYPQARIIVSTRPIGYSSNLLRAWRHYEIQPFKTDKILGNIECLVQTATKNSAEQANALTFAKVQIDRNKNAKIAARSPLILGLVSALIIQKVPLGDTKIQLYERLFRQMELAKRTTIVDSNLSSALLSGFLNILAWQILTDPTANCAALLARCADDLKVVLAESSLKAHVIAEKCFDYWERVGMIERISHAGIDAATFIHKTFGEYAAARYLANLPKCDARIAIDTHINDKAWFEVIVFASSLGLADEVLESRLEGIDDFTYKTVAEALSILADSEVPPTLTLRNKIFTSAAKYLRSPISREAISIGRALLLLNSKFPQEIVAIASPLTESEQACTCLAARSIMTLSEGWGRDRVELKRLVLELPDLINEVSRKSHRHGLFDFDAWPSTLIDVLYTFIFREVLNRFSSEDAGILLSSLLTQHFHNGTVGGQIEILTILREYDRTDFIEVLERPMKEQFAKAAIIFSNPLDGMTQLVSALKYLHPTTNTNRVFDENTIFWQLSGYLSATKIWHQPVREIWPDQIDPSDPAIQEVLRGCIIASGVDPNVLNEEVILVLNTIFSPFDKKQLSRFIYEHTHDVDIEMEWKHSKEMDLSKLEAALSYSAEWIVESATNLIEVNASPEELASIVKRVFDTGQGDALFAASYLCLLLPEPIKSELFIKRLEMPLVPGCQHLFSALAERPLPLDERLLKILRTGLITYDGPITATSAARVAENYVVGSSEVAALLQESYDLWCHKENPYPVGGGTVPSSPREQILKILLKRTDFDKLRLIRYSDDVRGDVKNVASTALFAAMQSGELRDEFLTEIGEGKIPPSLLLSALRKKVPFTKTQLVLICSFLNQPLADLQRAAMLVLNNDYLSTAEILAYASTLSNDPDPEIREHAQRMLQNNSNNFLGDITQKDELRVSALG